MLAWLAGRLRPLRASGLAPNREVRRGLALLAERPLSEPGPPNRRHSPPIPATVPRMTLFPEPPAGAYHVVLHFRPSGVGRHALRRAIRAAGLLAAYLAHRRGIAEVFTVQVRDPSGTVHPIAYAPDPEVPADDLA